MSNQQASSILEEIHKLIANLVHMFDLKKIYLNEDDSCAGILEANDFVRQSMYHTTLQATPRKLMFDNDLILNTTFATDWETIRSRKQ